MKTHVLIAGAGPCGLVIAHGLKKNGISFSIFEKAPGQRSRDWAVTMHWSLDIVRNLAGDDLANRINEAQPDPTAPEQHEIAFRNGGTGQMLAALPVPHAREISIRKFKNLLSEGIKVHRGRSLVDFQVDERAGTVEAIFDDGYRETGTILIGVEGNSSIVRRKLVPEGQGDPVTLPYTMMNFESRYAAEQALFLKERMHPLTDIAIHRKGMYCRVNILDAPDPNKPENWTFQILTTWPERPEDCKLSCSEQRLKYFKSLMSDWADPHKSAAMWIADDPNIRPDHLKQWAPQPWKDTKGHVTLAGDAAHAPTFHRGQGVNNAIADAELFVKKMVDLQTDPTKNLQGVIREYEEDVVRRGRLEVELSYSNTQNIFDMDCLHSKILKHGTTRSTEIDMKHDISPSNSVACH